MTRKIYDDRLYFTRMGGAGTILCLECNYEQEIVSFLHGVDWDSTGYQCQKCGKFHEIECEKSSFWRRRCDCGGKLDRDKPIFCPECKKSNLAYHMRIIT
jgi:hypothetical protein